jgi:hypothetical protein
VKYSHLLKNEAIKKRKKGLMYGEICECLGECIPKSTLSGWFKAIKIPKKGLDRLQSMHRSILLNNQAKAVGVNLRRREEYLTGLSVVNSRVCAKINDPDSAKIALAMLCLGEGSKYKPGRSFTFGNSNPIIINTFLILLDRSFGLDIGKLRATVQCRYDQDVQELQYYWEKQTGIPKSNFYKPSIDKRTIGKPTKKSQYKGVLRIDYFSSRVQLELEDLSKLVYNELCNSEGR